MMPPLSIITVCVNQAARIALTCDSVVHQTFQDFEWIVIDGGSTDGTLDTLKQYANRMNYFVSEPDRGVYHAMNKGIAQAHGVYLLFLNGGDYLYQPETLATIFASGTSLKKDLYYGDILFERTDGLHRYSLDFTNYYALLIRRTFPHQATFIKRTLFQKYGGYDESLKIEGDKDFFFRVLISNPERKRHAIEHLPCIVSVYENMQGISSRKSALKDAERELVRRRHYPAYYLRYYYFKKWFIPRKQHVMNIMKNALQRFRASN